MKVPVWNHFNSCTDVEIILRKMVANAFIQMLGKASSDPLPLIETHKQEDMLAPAAKVFQWIAKSMKIYKCGLHS